MRVSLVFLALSLAAVAAVPKNSQRIIGGSVTTISQYPSSVALLHSSDLLTYWQYCGGTLLNQQSILTAAHCVYNDLANRWRVRVGSTYANSGGVVHNIRQLIIHPNYDDWTFESDVAIIKTATNINYVNNAVQPGTIAGPNYNVGDNQSVWAAGWGVTSVGGQNSEQLRHVEVWTVNQSVCRQRYGALGWPVTADMLCSGWMDVGGRGQCTGDSGGPLYHNNIIIGVTSWAYDCAVAYYPGVNARVSNFTTWIQANA